MKLSGWTYIVIGLCLGLSAFVFVLIQFYMPFEQAVGFNETYRDQLTTEANKQRQADQRVTDAITLVQQKTADWNQIVAAKTPSTSLANGGINFDVNGYQLSVDAVKYRNNVQRAVNYQVKRGGVKVINGPLLPAPPEQPSELVNTYFNYANFGFPVAYYELTGITVEGTYNQIMANVKSWAAMPRYLAVADGLSITGTSPKLRGTYNVVMLGYLRTATINPFPLDTAPEAGGPNGGPAPGGPVTPKSRPRG